MVLVAVDGEIAFLYSTAKTCTWMVLLKEWINTSDFVFMIFSDLVLNETVKSFCDLVQFPCDHF